MISEMKRWRQRTVPCLPFGKLLVGDQMKITVLVENTTQGDLGTEHGLSLYIETGSHRVLFDTGQTDLFAENARKLGIRLETVDLAVLSHGHYDHGGGLRKFFEINQKAPVYISRYAFEPHYGADGKYIGLDNSLERNSRFLFTEGITKIGDGLTLYDCNDKERCDSIDAGGLYTEREKKRIQDDFCHEQYLLLEENGKKILISGCSHKGIVNIEEWFHPDVLIGGFHLFRLDADEKLQPIAQYLNSFPTIYYTCHCTGMEQYQYLSKYMDNLHYASAGQTIII